MGFFIIRHPIASLGKQKESTMGVFLLLDTRLHLWQAKKSPQWVFFIIRHPITSSASEKSPQLY